uniref:Uncharacterized protein n=1 Tax=Arundo donax TaxID=35708 RepID=A0A0A9B7W7_ARUDO
MQEASQIFYENIQYIDCNRRGTSRTYLEKIYCASSLYYFIKLLKFWIYKL